jgi:ribose transport system substrate-binding protein
VLNGNKNIPHDLVDPYLAITQQTLDAALPKIPVGGVASIEYSLDDAKAIIDANVKK